MDIVHMYLDWCYGIKTAYKLHKDWNKLYQVVNIDYSGLWDNKVFKFFLYCFLNIFKMQAFL